jgi:hypothetical protein
MILPFSTTLREDARRQRPGDEREDDQPAPVDPDLDAGSPVPIPFSSPVRA